MMEENHKRIILYSTLNKCITIQFRQENRPAWCRHAFDQKVQHTIIIYLNNKMTKTGTNKPYTKIKL
jgi:hypothetical protein